MRRVLICALALGVLPAGIFPAYADSKLVECPGSFEFKDAADYLDPLQQTRIRGIESNHLNPDVENLIKGQSGTVAGDLRFILNTVPNHHRALAALVRLALRNGTDMFADIEPYSVSC